MSWERAQVFRSLALMQCSGLPLFHSLELLSRQFQGSTISQPLERVVSALYQGRSLRQAVGEGAPLFDSFHQALISVGEQTGQLDRCFESMARHEEGARGLRQRVLAELTYPGIVFGAMLAMAAVGGPWLARTLPVSHSAPLTSPFLWLVLALGLVQMVRTGWLKNAVLSLPPVRCLRRTLATAQFLSTWSCLLSQGIPLLGSLQLAAHASNDRECQSAVAELVEQLRAGIPLERSFADSAYFTNLVKGTVSAGLECGSLPPLLEHLGNLYELEVTTAVQAVLSLVAPVLMLVLGLILLSLLLVTAGPLLNLAAQL